jgi:hypothetical protein
MNLSRRLRLVLFVMTLCIACTRPLKLSNEPSPAGEPLLVGLLSSVFDGRPTGDTVYLADSTIPFLQPRQGLVERFWTDSARTGFTLALTDLASRPAAPFDTAIARLLPPGVVFGRVPHTALQARPEIRAKLSSFGFSPDSTFAAVYVEILCGPLCGYTTLYLFARRPGCRWTRWEAKTFLVS